MERWQCQHCSKITCLVLRILTSLLLTLSLPIIATNTKAIQADYATVKIRFGAFYCYRYMLAVAVIGLAVILIQIASSIYSLVLSKIDSNVLFHYFTDKLFSYLIFSGAVAGFAVSVDAKVNMEDGTHFRRAFGAAALLLLSFFCTAVASLLSSFALTRRSV